MQTNFLDLHELTVRFGPPANTAIDRVSFSIGFGEIVAVLGASGSGKSTLLRAICGLVALESGTVVLEGVDITTTPTHQRGVGLMFQDHALFPHLSVSGNVAFGLRMARLPKDARDLRVEEVLQLVGLGGFESRSVSSLSGGEKQRVALARSIAPSPRLILLDEPMGSLDRILRDRLISDLHDVIEELDMSAIYVTHDRTEAFEIADRLAIMEMGRLLQIDAPPTVESAPASDYVARLLGHQ
ncbi:MAG: ABC transporter ATP-binding protein [Acidimicrobiales bacterium]